ncbi:hypothetical protein AWC18_00005 [Mycolicibacter nonchromogenicus]|uniref:PPE-PPW subfamily C-terminal domain-containing protein n=1 Tax=Mycolicibacter nonchromogenicus TaxID=1782 RepID=A0A1X1ZSK9_MYCNO|nr:hypothetical protein AWC18_00005 [Mycolicibacter nonchromogenicus]
MPAYMYLVGGLDMGARRGSGTSSRKKAAPKPDSAAAPAEEPAQQATQHRRRRRAKVGMLGRGHEYMDLEPEPVSVVASSRGVGAHGVAGGARQVPSARPGGLTALADDGFGSGAVSPMMPNTWPTEPD